MTTTAIPRTNHLNQECKFNRISYMTFYFLFCLNRINLFVYCLRILCESKWKNGNYTISFINPFKLPYLGLSKCTAWLFLLSLVVSGDKSDLSNENIFLQKTTILIKQFRFILVLIQKMIHMKILNLIGFGLFALILRAQDPHFKVEVSSDTILLGNYFELKYTIENTQGDFNPPEFAGLKLVAGPNHASSYSIMNGKGKAKHQLHLFSKA
jgi:hypothetical protein